jgi:predicted aconitase
VTDARRQVEHQVGQYFGRGVAVLPYMFILPPGSNDYYAFSASSAASANNSHRKLSLEKYRNFQALAICALFARGFADT